MLQVYFGQVYFIKSPFMRFKKNQCHQWCCGNQSDPTGPSSTVCWIDVRYPDTWLSMHARSLILHKQLFVKIWHHSLMYIVELCHLNLLLSFFLECWLLSPVGSVGIPVLSFKMKSCWIRSMESSLLQHTFLQNLGNSQKDVSEDNFTSNWLLLLLLSRCIHVWLCDPIDSSPPGSPVPGILQAGTLEWVSISFSNAWK